ncbi:hypothetical protein A4H97_14110 [Niastella yeongjuensis]|uniref:Uncharacterized protein n=1 Tax=Niastella yeongjuensis TaxID=354355 RepID=A0A1V9E3Q0_9BACT|nr:hypothetical protein [Niastella yeongjuensis]OQP40750.1 hypothetical protein A4H97_14110 [Niastella yeongjuensis]SEP02799.1 hypothetical protein SAMN05660816_04234 [Niastella yeongjuensis]
MKLFPRVFIAWALLLLWMPVRAQKHVASFFVRADTTHACADTVIVQPGTCNGTYFGDLLIRYTIDKSGTAVTCALFLASHLIGLHTLNATDTLYSFKVKLGFTWAKGSITLQLRRASLLSTLSGSFRYSVQANNTWFEFTGDLAGWYITD